MFLILISWNSTLSKKFMINQHQNTQTFIAFANTWINDIIDHKWNNQWNDTSEIVIFVKDSKSQDKYSDLLNSLFISNRSWTNIIMNFVIELSNNKDFNAILMIINRLTKMHHYIFCTTAEEDTNTEEIARLLINHVWKLHELSNIIIFDRRSQFISLVWKTVCQILKINVKVSIAFHSKTDDQNEIVNQEMKRYLRNYCNYQQDDWSEWLFMIEFASNAATSIFIELFVFMTNYEFESRMNFDWISNEEFVRERIQDQKTSDIIDKMKNIWNFIKQRLANNQNAQKRHADKKRNNSSEYKLNDIIWLFIKNIKIERSFKKLDHKWIDLYKIKKILKEVYQLNLSQSMKIHDTFHTSLLRSAITNSLIEQMQSSSSSVVMNEEKEYEINDILDNRYHYDKLQYKIAWIDHLSDKAWYSTENF